MKINKINSISSIKTNVSPKEVTNKNLSNSNEQIKELSNIYYQPISFGRSKAEHHSWGAQIDPKTKEATFKILTYPDSKKVEVTVEKRNNPTKRKTYTLKNMGEGIFATAQKLPAGEVENGDKYYYTIYKGNGDIDKVKDPYSFRQEQLLGVSTVYDHSLYKWNDDDWFKNNPNRISRKADSNNNLTPLNAARIYEFNTASLTKRGTFDAAKSVIKYLPEMGFNSIEIMPVENTYSFNWGYDGVDKMAPSEHLGGPDELKSMIDYAHKQGLNVIMDMVPNHLGPDGASLLKTGPFIKGNNCFGEAFNFEGKDSKYVRDYIVNSALNWIENYHCDGLRLDMTKFMESDTTMKQIAAEINYHHPDAFLIAEDSRSGISVDDNGNYWDNYDEPHDKRVLTPLKPYESGEGENEGYHVGAIKEIARNNTSLGRLGYDSEWDFNYFHSLKDALYGVVDMDAIEKASYCSQDRVKYIMSHDEIGNFEGSRLISKLMVPILHLNENIVLDSVDKKRAEALKESKGMSEDDAYRTVSLQKAQFVGEKLVTMLQTGELDKYDTSRTTSRKWAHEINKAFKKDILIPLGLKNSASITYNILKSMYERAYNKNKMAMARTFATPGPKMVFQGDERADLTPFRFFRQFESVKREDNLYFEKGYEPGISALRESTIGSIPYSKEGRANMSKFKALMKDLNKINEENPALVKGHLIPGDTVKHQASQVFATHAADNESGNELYAITNFSSSSYPRYNAADYYIKFPQGEWVEILNTDDKKYGGSGEYMNTRAIKSDGQSNIPIKLDGECTLIFKKVK
ncbi:alpha amylase C-terminal domain-containing protein [bacterium]|nr:alpha amylase C-terminal domain-containing protein [bacterium]